MLSEAAASEIQQVILVVSDAPAVSKVDKKSPDGTFIEFLRARKTSGPVLVGYVPLVPLDMLGLSASWAVVKPAT